MGLEPSPIDPLCFDQNCFIAIAVQKQYSRIDSSSCMHSTHAHSLCQQAAAADSIGLRSTNHNPPVQTTDIQVHIMLYPSVPCALYVFMQPLCLLCAYVGWFTRHSNSYNAASVHALCSACFHAITLSPLCICWDGLYSINNNKAKPSTQPVWESLLCSNCLMSTVSMHVNRNVLGSTA